MGNKIWFAIILLAAVAGQLPACAPPSSPAVIETTPSKDAGPAPGTVGQDRWSTVLAEGKKEGVVAIYTTFSASVRVALTKAFADRYGINAEFSTFSLGTELLAKLQAESRAGLRMVDVFLVGGTTLLATLKPEGQLGQIEPLLLLPELKEPKIWAGAQFPFLDKDRLTIRMSSIAQRFVYYNTAAVAEGDLTTYKDVLKPQYRGKITLYDPSLSGSGNTFFTHLARDLWSLEEAREFLRHLIVQQQVVIHGDRRLQVESVARGKYAIGLAAPSDVIVEFLQAGAPIRVVIPKEGVYTSVGIGGLGVPVRAGHPNAATVFVNWLLTREGQTALARSYGFPSVRVDVPTEGIEPIFLVKPGEKIFAEDEQGLTVDRVQMREVAKKIIEETRK